MLSIASANSIQIKPPDNLANNVIWRRASNLLFEKAEDIKNLKAKPSPQAPPTQEPPKSEAKQQVAEPLVSRKMSLDEKAAVSVLEEYSAQMALELSRPLNQVPTPPMPLREFLDLLFNEPASKTQATLQSAEDVIGALQAALGRASADQVTPGLSDFISIDLKV